MTKKFFRKKSEAVVPDEQLVNTPVSIDVYVLRILFPRCEEITGLAVFVGINDAGKEIVCRGNAPGISVGEHVRLNGTWQIRHNSNTNIDELQVHFNELLSLEFGNEEDIARYLEGLNVPGCGKQTIRKIIGEYGLSTIREINDHPETFASRKIFSVSQKVLEDICTVVTKRMQARRAYDILLKNGFPEKLSVMLSDRYGADTERILKEDCYLFALDNPEVTFEMIDAILRNARKESIKDEARLAAAIEYRVREETRNGHIYTSWDDIKHDVVKMIGFSEDDLKLNLSNAIGLINTGRHIKKKISGTDRHNYEFVLTEHADDERKIAENLYRMVYFYTQKKEIDAMIYLSENLNLSENQKNAVCNVFTHPVSVITGGPGTGKSYIAKAIYDTALKADLTCLAAAPTGRAAKRLEEAIFHGDLPDEDKRPQTIHRLLKATGPGKFTFGEKYQLHTDVLIIDEASMIDASLAKALLSSLSLDTRIVFMGDVNQLPSVGAGNFFEDLIETIKSCPGENEKLRQIPVTHLTDIYRQKEGSAIISNSDRINRGLFPVCSGKFGLPDDNFYFFETPTANGIPVLLDCVTKRIPGEFGFDPLKGIQVLLPVNVGRSGTDEVNIALRERLNPRNPNVNDYAVGMRTFRVGDKVMQKVNDYDLLVFNGDVGYIDTISDAGISVYYPDYDKLVFYNRSKAYNLTLAYAITVHKAQGAEFDAVAILMDERNSQNVIRKQLYTAITRAKQTVVMIGSRDAYMKALLDVNYIKRRTKLPQEILSVFAK